MDVADRKIIWSPVLNTLCDVRGYSRERVEAAVTEYEQCEDHKNGTYIFQGRPYGEFGEWQMLVKAESQGEDLVLWDAYPKKVEL